MNKSGQHKHRKGQNLYRKSELSLYSGTEAHEAASCPSKGGKVHSIWWNKAPPSWCGAHLTAHLRPLWGGRQNVGGLSLSPAFTGWDPSHGAKLSKGVCRAWGLVIVTCLWCPSCYLCQKGRRFFCSDGYTTLWMYLLALNCAQKMVTMVNFVFCMAYYNKKECHFFETSPLAILCVCGQATKPEHLGRLGLLHLHTALGHLHQVYFSNVKGVLILANTGPIEEPPSYPGVCPVPESVSFPRKHLFSSAECVLGSPQQITLWPIIKGLEPYVVVILE